MDSLKALIADFSLTAEERKRILKDLDHSMPDSFKRIAESVLSGCFVVSSEGKDDVRIYPTVVEFYYHEEGDGGIKDPIVYHRNTLSSEKNVIPIGIFHNHVSGVDITFERNIGRIVRASVLIRAFSIEGGLNKASMDAFSIPLTNNEHSTHIYAALFSQFSMFDGFTIKWEDGKEPAKIKEGERTNVYRYNIETNKKGQPISVKTDIKCPRLCQAIKLQ